MQKNYIQFLVFALVAIGMVMIAGIRNDVNSLQSQVALTGRAIVNKTTTPSTEEVVDRVVSVKTFTLAEIENTVKQLGWLKQTDGSYSGTSTSVERHYACPNCQGMGSGCCVVNGVGSPNSSGSEGCWGSYGTTNYQGICSVAKIATGSTVASKTSTSSNTSESGNSAERKKACQRSETCPQGQACKGGFCVPCWGQGCLDGATRVASSGSSNLLTSTLKKGMVSDQVTMLQKMLISLGYLSTTPSGNFLSKTEIAVKMFQTGYGISPVSGIVGELTRAKLNSICSINSTTKVVTCAH